MEEVQLLVYQDIVSSLSKILVISYCKKRASVFFSLNETVDLLSTSDNDGLNTTVQRPV